MNIVKLGQCKNVMVVGLNRCTISMIMGFFLKSSLVTNIKLFKGK